MRKIDYYQFFAECKKYIRFNPLLKELGISQSNFSKFMSGKPDYQVFMSEEKLKGLYDAIVSIAAYIVDVEKIA